MSYSPYGARYGLQTAQDCAYREDSDAEGFIPSSETTRVLALIDRGVTALVWLGGD